MLNSYLVLDSIQRMDHPYNHYRKHKLANDLQRYNKLKYHSCPDMDLYSVRWCMLDLPGTQSFVCTRDGNLVRVQCNSANMSIQLSNQLHGTVNMGHMDLVYILVVQAHHTQAVLQYHHFIFTFRNFFCTNERTERKEEEKKAKLKYSCSKKKATS